MLLQLNKRFIIGVLAVLFVASVGFLSTVSFTKEVDCFKNEDFCEYFVIDKDHKSLQTHGTILKKYSKNGIYYLLINTKRNDQKSTPLLYRLPPESIKVFINIEYKNLSQPKILNASPKEAYDMLQLNERTGLHILTPTRSEIDQAKKLLLDKKYASCFEQQTPIANYLSHPSLLSWLQLRIQQATSSCVINLTALSLLR